MTNNPYTTQDWVAVAPLFIVGGVALVVLLADLVARKYANRYVSIWIAIAGLAAGGLYAASSYHLPAHNAFGGGFILGGFSIVLEEVIIISAIFSLTLYGAIGREDRIAGSTALILWSTAGAMLMAGAANLMTIFLGLELLSLGLYCLCGLADRPTARESSLKYLILSSTASGFLLFGMAMLFGASGSITLASLTPAAIATNPLYWMGGGLFLVGLAFKLSLVPFHVWSPDVYEGAPLPVTAYMSVVTKAGTLAVFARFAYAALPPSSSNTLLMPFYVIAGISMIVGNVGMLAQTDMKRLLAYSGIAQIGYIVAALAGGTALGVRYAMYYLVAYMFMNLGAFAIVALMSTDKEEGSHIASFEGLAQRRPAVAAAMTFFLLALAGFPPTAGFLGKILILSTNLSAGFAWLAALLIAGTAISLYAYFKIIRLMYDRRAVGQDMVRVRAPLAYVSAAVCLAFILVMTFYPYTPSNVLPLPK
jgi:NADH-quinone oxidoreductase subunit N